MDSTAAAKSTRQEQPQNNKENPRYLDEQIISYIGNKRRLLAFIGKGIEKVMSRTGKNKLDIFDAFSGSGVVSRFLKRYSNRLITNDLELYSHTINRCYLSNRSEIPFSSLKEQHREMRSKLESGDLTQVHQNTPAKYFFNDQENELLQKKA